jgi:RNA polymerase sigma factor (sigma-70 family)
MVTSVRWLCSYQVRRRGGPECQVGRSASQIDAVIRRRGKDVTEEGRRIMTTEDGPRPSRYDPSLGAVMAERRHLINVAYRLLGSLAEAEDAVQETYARWYAMSPEQRAAIRSPGGWLTRVTSRVCLDVLGSARTRRERYVGEWLPEPLPGTAEWISGESDSTVDPADRITLDESVAMAFLVTLESMTPAERVALILHDVFGYSFPEVAEIVGRTPAACRQLASSARRRVRAFETPQTPTAPRHADMIRAFRKAWESQDIDALLRLLDPDATAIADGGGLPFAALSPIQGAEQVAHHYVTIADGMPDDVVILECMVNGQPGLTVQREGVTGTVLAFDVAGDRIKHIWAVLNPDKLQHWGDRSH